MPVTVNVVTGILGSGKTTVLLHLLDDPSNEPKPAVVVGEFAEEGYDGTLLRASGATVAQVAAAGIGEQAKSYLGPVRALVAEGGYTRILLETSGVTEIGRVARELSGAVGEGIRLGCTATILDAGAFEAHDAHFPDQLWAQVDVADVVVINKTDKSNPDRLKAARERVLARRPDARVVFAFMGQCRRHEILSLPSEEHVPRILTRDWEVGAPPEFESFVYRTRVKNLDRVRFGHRLLNLPGGAVARFKGVLRCWDRSWGLNGLPGQLDWDPGTTTGDTAIAFIGLGLKERESGIRETLDAELKAQRQ
jgi:G3E family GTPase